MLQPESQNFQADVDPRSFWASSVLRKLEGPELGGFLVAPYSLKHMLTIFLSRNFSSNTCHVKITLPLSLRQRLDRISQSPRQD